MVEDFSLLFDEIDDITLVLLLQREMYYLHIDRGKKLDEAKMYNKIGS